MSEATERYNRVADGFGRRVHAVTPAQWSNPAPCDGWAARDVVLHLAGWVPSFPFGQAGVAIDATADDPAEAWAALDAGVRAALADPEVAGRQLDTPMGRVRLDEAVATFVLPDVLVHTWDLARATGLDEALDADEVHRLLEAMEPMDEVLRQSGQYGPRVPVSDDADEQTRLIAFTGRQP